MKTGFVKVRRWQAPWEEAGSDPAGTAQGQLGGQRGVRSGPGALGPQEKARKSQHQLAVTRNLKSSICIYSPRLVQPFLSKTPFRTASLSVSWGLP